MSRRYPPNDTLFGRFADDGLICGFDIVSALLVLAVAFPVMLLVALAV